MTPNAANLYALEAALLKMAFRDTDTCRVRKVMLLNKQSYEFTDPRQMVIVVLGLEEDHTS